MEQPSLERILSPGDSEDWRVVVQFFQGDTLRWQYDTNWSGAGQAGGYFYNGSTAAIPTGTDRIQFQIHGRRDDGSYTDFDVDDVTLKVRFTGFPASSDAYFDDASFVLYPHFNVESLVGNNALTHLILPYPVTSQTQNQIQFGLRQSYSGPGSSTYEIRLPYSSYTTATLQALLRDPGSDRSSTQIAVDVGADGSTSGKLGLSLISERID